MQIFRDLLSWFNLVPFLFTVLAAPSPDYKFTGFDSKTESVPDCAASPTVFIALPFQFWLEVILLKPYIGVAQVFEPSNPVKINWDYPSDRNDDFTYSKAEITSQTNTQLFQLNYNFLQNAKEHGAVLWAYDSEYFPGYKALAWDETGPYGPDGVTFLDFVAVKKCTSTNQTELILRAKESFRDDSPYVNFVVGFDGEPSIFGTLDSNVVGSLATGEVSPITLRIRPFLPSTRLEQIPPLGVEYTVPPPEPKSDDT